MRKDLQEYYEALGLHPGASPVEIKRAYRQLVQRWHPDHFKSGTFMQTTAEDMTKEINEAYEQLIKRQLYKKALAKNAAARSATPFPFQRATPDTAANQPPPPSPSSSEKREHGKRRRRSPGNWRRHGTRAAASLAAAVLLVLAWSAMNPRVSSSPTVSPREGVVASDRTRSGATAPNVLPVSPRHSPLEPHPETATRESHAAPSDPIETVLRPRINEGPAPVALTAPPSGASVDSPNGKMSMSSALPTQGAFGSESAEASVLAMTPHELDRLFSNASNLLVSFDRGDSKAQVLAVQGAPDEVGETVIRFGSSLVYFADGRVTSWVDRVPRLRVRTSSHAAFDLLETFDAGSSRDVVQRLQGVPDVDLWGNWLYGPTVVYFEHNRVTGWADEARRLRLPLLR